MLSEVRDGVSRALVNGTACEHPAIMELLIMMGLELIPWFWLTLGARCFCIPMQNCVLGELLETTLSIRMIG